MLTLENRIKNLLKDIKNNCKECLKNTGDCLGRLCAWYDIEAEAEKIYIEIKKGDKNEFKQRTK